MKKYSSDYKRQVTPFKQRFLAIWFILTRRNFILIYGIEEFIENSEKGRKLHLLRRTDYGGDSDQLSCIGASKMCKKNNI